MADQGRLGGQIGRKVAGLVADSTVATRVRTARLTHDVAMQVQDSFFRLVGEEAKSTVGEVFARVADHEEAPPWVKRMFGFLARGTGQWQALMALRVGAGTLAGGLGDLINNELAPVTHALIADNPHGVIPLPDAISGVARGLIDRDFGSAEARKQGLPVPRFDVMTRLSRHGLDPAGTLEALNRGVIGEREARQYLREAGFTDDAADDFLRLRRLPLTPADAATLENFGVITREQGRDIANAAGMVDADYDRLALGGGQPPGLEELLAAFRRGIIDHDRLRKGIQQSPVRTEWFDVIEKLRFSPPSAPDALNAATQNLLSEAEAKRVVEENGIDPSAFGWLLESAGRPLSPEQAGELFNRGFITAAQARQMFLESNIKNKYVDLIPHLFERVPTMEMTVRMVREGAITREQGVANLRALGFNQANAASLIELGAREKTTQGRDLAQSQVRELYRDRAISLMDATAMLTDIGYSADEAALLLSLADLQRARRFADAAVSRVRSAYVTRHIDETTASNALDRLHVPTEQRDDLLTLWDLERSVVTKELTTSQVETALRRGIIGEDEAAARWAAMGWADDDIAILIALAAPAPRRR